MQSGFDEQNPSYATWRGTVAGLGELVRYHQMPDWQPIWLPEGPATADAAR